MQLLLRVQPTSIMSHPAARDAAVETNHNGGATFALHGEKEGKREPARVGIQTRCMKVDNWRHRPMIRFEQCLRSGVVMVDCFSHVEA